MCYVGLKNNNGMVIHDTDVILDDLDDTVERRTEIRKNMFYVYIVHIYSSIT